MKIQLVRQKRGRYEIIRNYNHSEDIIIQRTRIKILDEFKNVNKMYLLEGLGQLSWLPIETTGNHEVFAQIFVGDEIDKTTFGNSENDL